MEFLLSLFALLVAVGNPVACAKIEWQSTKGSMETLVTGKRLDTDIIGRSHSLAMGKCIIQCQFNENCKSAVFDTDNEECVFMSANTLFNPFRYTLTDSASSTFFQRYDVLSTSDALSNIEASGYTLVFRAAKETGYNLWAEWNNFTHHDDTPEEAARLQPGCVSVVDTIPCDHIYRHSILDEWPQLTEVLITLFKDGSKVFEIAFNAYYAFSKDDFIAPWFVIRCSVNELDGDYAGAFVKFDVEGLDRVDRRFYLTKAHGGCDNDEGWLMVLGGFSMEEEEEKCEYESHPAYPVFMYTTTDTSMRWGDFNFGMADVLSVYTK